MQGTPGSLPTGTEIAGYRIEREVGRGAMAVVYRAMQLNLQRPVALKILTSELAENEEFVARFFNEARAAAALSHANIIQAYDAGVSADGICYFAMEFVEGETLLDRIRREGALEQRTCVKIALEVANALSYGWEKQTLTHGDIKPENIMLSEHAETKLADFGLAKVAEHDYDGTDILLTPLYGAPERIRGNRDTHDCRADIYSFGATLYHMLAGSPPFPGTDSHEVMRRHLEEPLEPLNRRCSGVPQGLSDFVGALLSKDPDARPGTWQEVAQGLRQVKIRLSKRKRLRAPGRFVEMTPPPPIGPRPAPVREKAAGVRGILIAVAVGLLILIVAVLGGDAIRQFLRGSRPLGKRHSPAPVIDPTPVVQPIPPPGDDRDASASEAEAWNLAKAAAADAESPSAALQVLLDFAESLAEEERPEDFADAVARARETLRLHQAAEQVREDAVTTTGVPVPDVSLPPTGADGETPVPQPDEDDERQLADARWESMIEYLAAVASFRYSVNASLEPLVDWGNEWLLRHAGESDERLLVAFLVETAFPAVEAVVPEIIVRKRQLLGKRFPLRSRRYRNCYIVDLTETEIRLEKRTEHGKLLHTVPWGAVEDPRYLLYLSRLAYQGGEPLARERRPYLALALMSRVSGAYSTASEGLVETGEKRMWDELNILLDSASESANALRRWHAAQDACEAGQFAKASELLQELKASRTAPAFRYRDRITAMERLTAAHVPEFQAADLVRQARQVLGERPDKAARLAAVALNRYGEADFPERRFAAGLIDEALELIPIPEAYGDAGRRWPVQAFPLPFLTVHTGSPPVFGAAFLATVTSQVPPETNDVGKAMAALRAVTALETGRWAKAHAALSSFDRTAIAALPPRVAAAVTYAKGLTELRFADRAPSGERVVRELRAAALNPALGSRDLLPVLCLPAEYALAARQQRLPEDDLIPWEEAVRCQPEQAGEKRRFLNAVFAWLLQSDQTGRAIVLAERALADADSRAAWGLGPDDVQALTALVAAWRGNGRIQAVNLADGQSPGQTELRLLLDTLLVTGSVSYTALNQLWETAQSEAGGFGAVGGTLLYDLTVLRTAECLRRGDLAGAEKTVAETLEQTVACLDPYYPRLILFRAGLACLNGREAEAREILTAIELATVACKAELACAKMFEGDRDDARDLVRPRPDLRFWYAWLLATEPAGQADAEDRRRTIDSARISAHTRAERMLAQDLRTHLNQDATER